MTTTYIATVCVLGVMMTVSCHVITVSDWQKHWNDDLEHIHEAEGDLCHAHTHSHLLLEIDQQYQANHQQENIIAHQYVEMMKKQKYSHSYQERSLLFSEYDDKIDNLPVIHIPVVFQVLYDRVEYNLSQSQLESQIRVLNQDFRANNTRIRNDDTNHMWDNRTGDAKIEFSLNATVRRQVKLRAH